MSKVGELGGCTGHKLKDFLGDMRVQSAKVSSVFLVPPAYPSLFIFLEKF